MSRKYFVFLYFFGITWNKFLKARNVLDVINVVMAWPIECWLYFKTIHNILLQNICRLYFGEGS